jgi:phosphatidylserine/phosphatidylglycerophosphate/cardiolipin synthase-like enzyme
MDRERYWIGLAAAKLVRQLPLTVITAVADAVERVVDVSSASAHSSVLHDLPNPEFRDMAAKFLHVWRDKAPALPSQAVAAALTAAAHVERDHLQNESIEIVWTGPETADTKFRHTEQAILEVLSLATKRLTVVSYAVYRIPRIRDALVAAANRGASIRLVVETPNRIESQNEYDCLLALGENVASVASVYYWPHENRGKDDNGKIGILHVKCAVADGHRLFLSSANLTDYAFTINMELGLLVTGGKLPQQVEEHFDRLMATGTLARVH